MGTPVRVLLVEDSANVEKLLSWRLKYGGYDPDVFRVETAEDMKRALRTSEFDIVISDYRLPTFSGPDALELLRGADIDLPFINVSGTVGEAIVVVALLAGAFVFVL